MLIPILNAANHQDDQVEAVVRGAAVLLILLYLPAYSPWLNLIKMRCYQRKVIYCEIVTSLQDLVAAILGFFAPFNEQHQQLISTIGAKP